MHRKTWVAMAALVLASAPLQAAPTIPSIKVHITQVPFHMAVGPYEKVLHVLSEARQTGNIRMYSIGHTAEGRNIPLVAMTPIRTHVLPSTRMLIICAQHGDEPDSAYAMANLILQCARRKNPGSLLKSLGFKGEDLQLGRVLWLIVPMANPDGLEHHTRENGEGVDLNRDWLIRTQPETQAIKRVFDRWSPQIVLDLHNWTKSDPPPADTGLEMTTRSEDSAQVHIERKLAVSALAAVRRWGKQPIHLVTSGLEANPTLAHRYFASRGAVSFLIETAATDDYHVRKQVLSGLVLLLSSRVDHMHWPDADKDLTRAEEFHYPAQFQNWLEYGSRFAAASGASRLRVTGLWAALLLWLLLVGIRQRSIAQGRKGESNEQGGLVLKSLTLRAPCARSRIITHQPPGPIGRAHHNMHPGRTRITKPQKSQPQPSA